MTNGERKDDEKGVYIRSYDTVDELESKLSAAQQEIQVLKASASFKMVEELKKEIDLLKREVQRLDSIRYKQGEQLAEVKKEASILREQRNDAEDELKKKIVDSRGGLKILKAFEVDGRKFKELSAIKDVK